MNPNTSWQNLANRQQKQFLVFVFDVFEISQNVPTGAIQGCIEKNYKINVLNCPRTILEQVLSKQFAMFGVLPHFDNQTTMTGTIDRKTPN